MTATAEKRTRDKIISTLQLCPPVVIQMTPDRANIFYGVLKSTSIEKVANTLVSGLKKHRMDYPKTIVFCRT
jgi:superfamily II DNA helicase RecQ